MLNQKMKDIMAYVNSRVAEREELVHMIALALLTRKNLFVLGDTGQAKSYAIDLFRSCISDAKQFNVVMSKQTSAEELFGRLDLSSIIPGNVSHSALKNDDDYQKMAKYMERLLDDAANDADGTNYFAAASELQQRMETYRKCMAELKGGKPEYITEGKIPDSHICFLDEIFKAGGAILNTLLQALNERRYTNEGISTQIPVISFFSASNEIPNFKDRENENLKPLYDRFDLKVVTEYISDHDNRINALKNKQNPAAYSVPAVSITLSELSAMQEEVKQVQISEQINELADCMLCELRGKGIHISDRTYLNYGSIVQAEAWLNGRAAVVKEDMKVLVNYFWNEPEERVKVREIIGNMVDNQLQEQLDEIFAEALNVESNYANAKDKVKALVAFRDAIVAPYKKCRALAKAAEENGVVPEMITATLSRLEELNSRVHQGTGFTSSLDNLMKIQEQKEIA